MDLTQTTGEHILPPPFDKAIPAPQLVTQGAEALIFKTHFLDSDVPCALKYRPSKPYRHPTLDVRLTRHRILSEARTLVRCQREGVVVPGVLSLDWEGGSLQPQTEGHNGLAEGQARRSGGWMMMEWIEGETIRKMLDLCFQAEKDEIAETKDIMMMNAVEEHTKKDTKVKELMSKIGHAVGKMHNIGVVHGDLTTSNLILRPKRARMSQVNGSSDQVKENLWAFLEGEVVLIDFGLSGQAVQDEDRAVDLYVLERAFGSTHPMAAGLFQDVLYAYGESYKGAKIALKRLEEVRMRGRKRSMLG
ncbi:serine/threonine-protein kinase bud32 [Agyrium rufum]|nr:serine/threonine-protein kinase bud32 [Agyrium rufum]